MWSTNLCTNFFLHSKRTYLYGKGFCIWYVRRGVVLPCDSLNKFSVQGNNLPAQGIKNAEQGAVR